MSFSYAEKGKNERLLSQGKRQSRVNYCPYGRKPHEDKAIQIEAYQPRKGKGYIKSAQENKGITRINNLANPSGSFDPEGSQS